MAHNVNPQRLALFTDALRSGRFKQGQGALTSYTTDGTQAHCCLGVACIVAMENGLELSYIDTPLYRIYTIDERLEILDGEPRNGSSVLPIKVAQWYGFTSVDPFLELGKLGQELFGNGITRLTAVQANDERNLSFKWIADAFDRTYGPKS